MSKARTSFDQRRQRPPRRGRGVPESVGETEIIAIGHGIGQDNFSGGGLACLFGPPTVVRC